MTADRKDNTPQEVTAHSQGARLFAWRRGFNAMHLIEPRRSDWGYSKRSQIHPMSRRGKSQTG